MTREEAIEAVYSKTMHNAGEAATLVDALIALGVLKRNEPPKLILEGRLAAAFQGRHAGPIVFPISIKYALEAAGLELVEKK